MTLDNLKSGFLFSGGQSPFRDELVKVIAAKKFGLKIAQQIHDIDRFGKNERANANGSTQNAGFQIVDDFTISGQTPWFSATKLCDFLGPFGINPDKLKDYGISLERLARPIVFDDIEEPKNLNAIELRTRIAKMHAQISQSGYFGIVGSEDQMIAAVTLTNELAEKLIEALARFFFSLRNSVAGENCKRVNEAIKAQRDSVFDAVNEHRGESLSALYLAISRQIIEEENATNCELGLTSDFFDISRGYCRFKFLDQFIRHYEVYADAYNAAVRGSGFYSLDKRKREFPYFIAVENEYGWGPRKTLYIFEDEHIGNLESMRTEAMRLGRRVLIIPKALVLPFEIRSRNPLCLLADGSRYMPTSTTFLQNLKDAGCEVPAIMPIVRISLEILDALSAVDETFILPAYLRKPFGAKTISAKDFAAAWHVVYEKYAAMLFEFAQTKPNDTARILEILIKYDYIDRAFIDFYRTCFDVSFEIADEGITQSRSERRRKKEEIQEKGFNGIENARIVLNREIDQIKFRAVTEALTVTESLMHWQRKTFYHWVKIIGQGTWLSEIVSRAQVYIEE
ncbi:MAG: hypothetical protein AB1465_06055 [Patescibacteria group bacterium]